MKIKKIREIQKIHTRKKKETDRLRRKNHYSLSSNSTSKHKLALKFTEKHIIEVF